MQRYAIGSYPEDIAEVLGLSGHDPLPFGETTVGIFDEEEGGIIAYASEEIADRIVSALNVDHDLQL